MPFTPFIGPGDVYCIPCIAPGVAGRAPMETPMPLDGTATRKKKIPVAAASTDAAVEIVRIEKPKIVRMDIVIKGISPYVQHKFSEKARKMMEERQRAGSQANKNRKREPKDFEQVYRDAMHVSREGWKGIPAPAFRNAMISACRLVGFKMTLAKLSVFVEADGFDADDGTPLVKIKGEPRIHEATARNESGVADIRWRPMWEDWSASVTVSYDEAQFSATDVVNLMARAGLQVGIGEGRPDSPNSNGLGWGRWEVVG